MLSKINRSFGELHYCLYTQHIINNIIITLSASNSFKVSGLGGQDALVEINFELTETKSDEIKKMADKTNFILICLGFSNY